MQLKRIFQDKEFLHRLFIIALPLVLQEAINASVNLFDSLMVGSFGDFTLAGVNLSNAFFFLFKIMIYGTVAGGSVLNAQFWGKKDRKNIHHVMGFQLLFALIIGTIFASLSFFVPQAVLSVYTSDPEVIRIGAEYLHILAPAYLFYAVGQVYSGVIRSCGNTRATMRISGGTLVFDTLLSWILIFGNFGAPRLGVRGAAFATLSGRFLECIVLIAYSYIKNEPSAAPVKRMLSFKRELIRPLVQNMLPVLFNESAWALASNLFQKIYAGISTAAIAAFSAFDPVDNLAFVCIFAVGDACAVIIGNTLGAGEKEKAYTYGTYGICFTFCIGIFFGILLTLFRGPILNFYNLSKESHALANSLLLLESITLWVRASNYMMVIGALRAGGDAKICLLLDLIPMWFFGLPLTWYLANRAELSLTWVYLGRLSEEYIKFFLIMARFRSKKWVNTLI